MPANIGFFTSNYGEPRSYLFSLGDELSSRISEDNLGSIFNSVNEYNSTNSYIDYRVIYIKNIGNKEGMLINTPIITINHKYPIKREIFKQEDITKVQINLFAPYYLNVNQIHPKIYSNGEFVESNYYIPKYITDNKNSRYYGSSIFLDFVSLQTENFFPIILERVIQGPVPFVKQFSFSISAKYTIVAE